MKELIKAIKRERKADLKKDLDKIKTEEGFKQSLQWEGKTYKGTEEQQKIKYIKYVTKKNNERLNKELNKITEVNKAESFSNLTITIEWTKSYMWGSNPKAYTNYGFISSSIGGGGYCKTSTATAQALNSDDRILKLLYKAKNKFLKNNKNTTKDNNEILGYGSGYNTLPSFCGGVGVSSHEGILLKLGLKMESVSNTTSTNVYIIRKATKQEKIRGY